MTLKSKLKELRKNIIDCLFKGEYEVENKTAKQLTVNVDGIKLTIMFLHDFNSMFLYNEDSDMSNIFDDLSEKAQLALYNELKNEVKQDVADRIYKLEKELKELKKA